MGCLCLIALQISRCGRSGWFSDYWSVPGIGWSGTSLPASVSHCGGSSHTRNLHPLDLKIGHLCPLAKLHQDESGPEYVKKDLYEFKVLYFASIYRWRQSLYMTHMRELQVTFNHRPFPALLNTLSDILSFISHISPFKFFELCGFLVLLSIPFLPLASYLTFLCLIDCEIRVTILHT